MNTHEITRHAACLAQWFRYSLDARLADLRHAGGIERDAACVRGWQFWKMGSWGKVPEILLHHYDETHFGFDPVRIRADLESLFHLCQPLPRNDVPSRILTPSEAVESITSMNALEAAQAVSVYGKNTSELRTMAGAVQRLHLASQAREIESKFRG